MINFSVDVVYTWVDGGDPAHQKLLTEISGKHKDYCRFADNDELYYSVYSIYKFAPWVRKIFIVVADYQEPKLQGLPQEILAKVKFVKHSEIMPSTVLPTFSSRAIEACIYKIPDLSEHFIYFNDDMFLGAPVKPSDFFCESGKGLVLIKLTTLGCWRWDVLSYFNARDGSFKYTRKLVYRALKQSSWLDYFLPYTVALHQACPCLKSVFEKMYLNEDIGASLFRVVNSRLRDYSTVMPIVLMQFFGLLQGDMVIKKFKEHIYFEVKNKEPVVDYQKILKKKPKLFCVNNDLKSENKAVEWSIRKFLEKYLS